MKNNYSRQKRRFLSHNGILNSADIHTNQRNERGFE